MRLRIDDDGEVLAKGNVVFNGYWQQPDQTALALPDGWFHTGDGGELDEDGYLGISDRKKDVIITGGENVSSIEVEDVLCEHPAVAEAAVIGVPDQKWGEAVKAIVVLRPGHHATEAELIRHSRDRLAHYKCPTIHRAPRRPGPYRHREGAEVQAAGALLGGAGTSGQLTSLHARLSLGRLAPAECSTAMAPLVPMPLTGDRLADFVLATLGEDGVGAGGAWTLGVEGAIAEMASRGDRFDLRRAGRTIEARTAGGGLRFALTDEVRAFTDPHGGPRAPVLLAVPRTSLPAPLTTVTVLGPDRDALDPTARGQILVDLGLGRSTASFAVRTGDPGVLDLLHGVAGRPWQDVLAIAGDQLVAASPTRVVRTAIARAEVHTRVPTPDERSPDGPHTHLLPRLLHLGRELPTGLDLPAGYAPAASYHPPH